MLQQREVDQPKKRKFPQIRDIPGTFTKYPTMEEAEKKTKMAVISIKVRPEEKEKLMAEAKKNHMTISKYMRKLILEKGFGYLDVKDMPEYHQELLKQYNRGWLRGAAEEQASNIAFFGDALILIGLLLLLVIVGVFDLAAGLAYIYSTLVITGLILVAYGIAKGRKLSKEQGPNPPEEK